MILELIQRSIPKKIMIYKYSYFEFQNMVLKALYFEQMKFHVVTWLFFN
jgi:hypothetical protein